MRPLAIALALALPACALTNKGDAVWPRYFTPEPFAVDGTRATRGQGSLRLGRVEAAAHLRERMVWRAESGEVGFYDDRRWTEKPEVYLRRALEHALFEEAGLKQVIEGDALTLDVELVEFEELRGIAPKARLRANVTLHDARAVAWQDTVVVEQPVAADWRSTGTVAIVRALAATLRESVRTIAARAVRETARVATTPPEADAADGPSVANKP